MKATEKLGVVDFIVYKGKKKEIVNFCSQFKENWKSRFYYDKEFSIIFIILPGGDQSLHEGDILVRNALGEYFPVDKKTFTQLYVPYLEIDKKIDS